MREAAESQGVASAVGEKRAMLGKEAERLETSSALKSATGDRHCVVRDERERSSLGGTFPFGAGDPRIPEGCRSASLTRNILFALPLLRDDLLSSAVFPLQVAKFRALDPGSPALQKTIGSRVTELFSVHFFRNTFVQVTC